MIDVERWQLADMVALCGWTAVRVGRILIGPGEAAWVRALRLLTPAERVGVAAKLGRTRLLTVTPDAAEKLKAWKLSHPRRCGLPVRFERMRALVQFFGDPPLLEPVVLALALLPEPVADYAVQRCMFLATGRSTGGWFGPMLPILHPIVIAGHQPNEVIRSIIMHESAHPWVQPERRDARLLTAYEAMDLRSEPGASEDDENRRREEGIVKLLARAWEAGAVAPGVRQGTSTAQRMRVTGRASFR